MFSAAPFPLRTPPHPVLLEVGGATWERPLWTDGPPARAMASVRAAQEEPGPRGPQERVDLQSGGGHRPRAVLLEGGGTGGGAAGRHHRRALAPVGLDLSLAALCPGPGQVLSWTGVHTASPIGLWATASQGVEALPCGKDCTLRSLDCTGVFGAKRDGLISCYFREPGKTMAKMQGGGRSRWILLHSEESSLSVTGSTCICICVYTHTCVCVYNIYML